MNAKKFSIKERECVTIYFRVTIFNSLFCLFFISNHFCSNIYSTHDFPGVNFSPLPFKLVKIYSLLRILFVFVQQFCRLFSIYYFLFLHLQRMRTSLDRPVYVGNTVDHFYSSLSDERKISLKRDVPSYPKVISFHRTSRCSTNCNHSISIIIVHEI